MSLKVKDTDVGLKRFEEATFYFCRLILLHPTPPPTAFIGRGVPDEHIEERKNDEERDAKGVMKAGEGVVWSQIRRQLKSVGIVQFFSLIDRATVATANSTPYLVCLLP